MFWKFLLIVILLFIGFLVYRAYRFVPEKKEALEKTEVDLDFDQAISNFSEIIKIPTVSHTDGVGEDEEVFDKMLDTIKDLYPGVFEKTTFEKVGRRGFLFHWKGQKETNPSVFMAHYDVVPVDEAKWTFDPFSGEVKDGYLFGRGTLDTKGTFVAVLETAEKLLEEGFVPEDDIYLAFSGEEEPHGPSADLMAQKIHEKNHEIKFVLDEGGAVVENIFPGTDNRIAVIGIGEKGVMDLKLKVGGKGGHASQPPAKSLVGKLSKGLVNIENNPMPIHLNPPFVKLIDKVGRYASFPIRIVLANLKIFKPVLNLAGKKLGGELNALMRTSFAFTTLEGSKQINVMPPSVEAGINIRCLKEDSKDDILNHIKKVSKIENLDLEVPFYEGASNYSKTDVASYRLLEKSINETWEDAIVSPYLMIAASDSRYYSKFSDRVYRFSAMEMTKEERGLIHGEDEKIRLEEWKNTLRFYYRIMKRM